MTKIEYDNFPKFLVSLGTVLIALPFVVLLFFIQENAILLVPEESLSTLTDTARETIHAKQRLSSNIATGISLLAILCFFSGGALLFFGCIKWNKQQKKIDEVQRINCEKAICEWERLNQTEKQEEVEREIDEKGYPLTVLSNEEIRVKQDHIRKEKAEIQKQIIRRNSEVEDIITKALKRTLGKEYIVFNDSGKGGKNRNYNIVAESVIDDQDYLFEIKYLSSLYSWNTNVWKTLPSKIRMLVEGYEQNTNRKIKPVLLLILADDNEDQLMMFKTKILSYWANESDIIVSVFTESKINTLTKSDILGSGILSKE